MACDWLAQVSGPLISDFNILQFRQLPVSHPEIGRITMTAFAAATLYFGLFGLLMLGLKMNVGRVRSAQKVGFGDGNNEAVQRAIRVQGNAVEDVPFVLIGIAGLAALAAPVLLIHGLGASFLVGRLLHAVGLGGSSGTSFGRLFGTVISMIVMLVTSGACIWFALT
jgi:uncharacterized protein